MSIHDALHAQIEAERKAAFPVPGDIDTFRQYTAGVQPLTLSEGQKRILKGLLAHKFCDNLCRRIVATPAERVRVVRFDVADKSVSAFLQDVWTKNHLPKFAARAHFTTVRDGNMGVVLGWNPRAARVSLMRELWWNGDSGLFCAYDDEGEMSYAVKEWWATVKTGDSVSGDTIERVKRRTIWFPNRIERFVHKATGWERFPLPAQFEGQKLLRAAEQPGPVPWTVNMKPDGEPLGIPVVHFARMQAPTDLAGQGTLGTTVSDFYGDSILLGGVVGNQDVVNDLHLSLVSGARIAGVGCYFAKGISLYDAKGNPVELVVEPGGLIHVEDENGDLKMLAPSDLSQIMAALEVEHRVAARATATPIHVISGEWPSGVALIEADKPLLKTAQALCDSFGPSWASVMHKACVLANAFGKRGLKTDKLISTVFEPLEDYDLVTLAALAEKLASFVSQREILRLLRYSDERIDQVMDEIRTEGSFAGFAAIPGSNGGATSPDEGAANAA